MGTYGWREYCAFMCIIDEYRVERLFFDFLQQYCFRNAPEGGPNKLWKIKIKNLKYGKVIL